MLLEFVLGAVVELGRLEQRLGRNTACIEAGATKGVFAIPVLPLVDAGDTLAMLCRANGRDVSRGACTDNDNVVTLAQCYL